MRRALPRAIILLLVAGGCTPKKRVEPAERPRELHSHKLLRDAAVTALRRLEGRIGSLDENGRQVSWPSIQMMLEDADRRLASPTASKQDDSTARRLLETVHDYAHSLSMGLDPYRGARGVLVKAYRSDFDGTLQPYALAVPRAYDATHPWPLLVALHGASSDHLHNLHRVFGAPGSDKGDVDLLDKPLPEAPMLVVSPLGRGELMSYDGLGEADVLQVLADVRRVYNVDPDRIYLTGLSMGGGGTWHIGLRHPDLFAALVPVCAVVDPKKWIEPAEAALYDDAYLALQTPLGIAENAINQRVFIYHGAADDVIPVADSRRMVERFTALGWLGKTVTYSELPGVKHNAWDTAYRDGNIFRLLAGIKRDPHPPRVVFKTTSLRYPKAFWLRIDRIDRGGAHAEIDGEQRDGSFTVRVANVGGFSLLLDTTLAPAGRRVTVRIREGQPTDTAAGEMVFDRPLPVAKLTAKGAAKEPLTLSFARQGESGGGRWRHVTAAATGAPPDHAVTGLMSRSLPRAAAHAYVYGTAGPPAVTEAGQALARALANWGPGVRAQFPVKADHEVTAEDMTRLNLVLIGTGRTNKLVGRMAGRLPLRDDAAAGDRAYRLVLPNPLAPSRLLLIYGADSVPALQRLRRFARPNKDQWAPETNLDYIVFDDRGQVERSGVFRDDYRVPTKAP